MYKLKSKNYTIIVSLLFVVRIYSMETDTGIDNNLFSVNNLYEPAILSRWLPTDERPENVERIKEYCLDDSSERVRSRRLVENNGAIQGFME